MVSRVATRTSGADVAVTSRPVLTRNVARSSQSTFAGLAIAAFFFILSRSKVRPFFFIFFFW